MLKSIVQISILLLVGCLLLSVFWAQTNLFNSGKVLEAECVGTIHGGYIFKRNGYLWIYFTPHHLVLYHYYAFPDAYWKKSQFSLVIYRNQYVGIISCRHIAQLSKHSLIQFYQHLFMVVRNWCRQRYDSSPIINKLFFNISNQTFSNQNAKIGINYLFCLSMIHLYILIKVRRFLITYFPWFKLVFDCFFCCYLLGFLLLEHNSIPYYRAFLFLLLRKFCRVFGWKLNCVINLSFSALIMLSLNLMVAFNYGFLLSYLYSGIIVIIMKYERYRLSIINKIFFIGVIFVLSFFIQSWIGSGYSPVQLLMQPLMLLLLSVMIMTFFVGFWVHLINTIINIYATEIIPTVINYCLRHNILFHFKLTNWEFVAAILILVVLLLNYNNFIKKQLTYLVIRKKLLCTSYS